MQVTFIFVCLRLTQPKTQTFGSGVSHATVCVLETIATKTEWIMLEHGRVPFTEMTTKPKRRKTRHCTRWPAWLLDWLMQRVRSYGTDSVKKYKPGWWTWMSDQDRTDQPFMDKLIPLILFVLVSYCLSSNRNKCKDAKMQCLVFKDCIN